MVSAIQLQDIEELRRAAGIDDVELRGDIRTLRVGDVVRITLTTGPTSFETRLVRITSIRGDAFRGKLADRPDEGRRRQPPSGTALVFTTTHIHSISRQVRKH